MLHIEAVNTKSTLFPLNVIVCVISGMTAYVVLVVVGPDVVPTASFTFFSSKFPLLSTAAFFCVVEAQAARVPSGTLSNDLFRWIASLKSINGLPELNRDASGRP